MTLDNLYCGNLAIAKAAAEKDENEEEVRRISGIASTGAVDRAGTIVDQKSLRRAARLYDERNGKMFYNHNWAWSIGVRESLKSDGDHLRFTGRLLKNMPFPVRAGAFGLTAVMMNTDDLWSSIVQGGTSSLSIGFLADAEEGELNEKTGERGPTILRVTDLLEVSVVSIPANADAEFTAKRAMQDPLFNAFLDETRDRSRVEDTISQFIEGRDLWGFDEDANAATAAGHGDGAAHDPWAQMWEELGKCLLPQRKSPRSKLS